ncbi:hypothetical protein AGABI1DRAFT_129020 [Agaricus bisporus var. burnettii JB137-S8]|uniref:Uncharacterized protein n=1 Tax=Agaricus bisporus var. burnettii (strain JB137-S8 / ATCC MYA-4627 / FGSC 10392) TaxID=597362 RepID=K5X6Z1_AGABU|nr:uncharacterized protein AGABI1DRAFT_129020 [Agaricus bisporus var. burnettii JB137-S8]EKM78732.1 hypothetical protein AGABI1DRAFT_129020 [Agaricus bisporus var. burnettii JB137-S8]
MAAVEANIPPSIPHPIAEATVGPHASNTAVKNIQELESADSQLSLTDTNATSLPEVTKLALDDSAPLPPDTSFGSMKLVDAIENSTHHDAKDTSISGETEMATVSPNDITAHDISESTTTLVRDATEDSLMENDVRAEVSHASLTGKAPTGLLSSDSSTIAAEITGDAVPVSGAMVLTANEDESVSGSEEIKGDPSPANNVEEPVMGQDVTETVSSKSNEELEKEETAMVADTESVEQDGKAENPLVVEDAKAKVDEGEAQGAEMAADAESEILEEEMTMPTETTPIEQIPSEEEAKDRSAAEDSLGSVKEEAKIEVDQTDTPVAGGEDKVAESTADEVGEETMKVELEEADERKDEPVEPAVGGQTEESKPTESLVDATTADPPANETPISTTPAENLDLETSNLDILADPKEDSSAPGVSTEEKTSEETIASHPEAENVDPPQATAEGPVQSVQEKVLEATTATANEASPEKEITVFTVEKSIVEAEHPVDDTTVPLAAESHPAAEVEANSFAEELAVPNREEIVLKATNIETEPAVEHVGDITPASTQPEVAAQESSTEMAHEPVADDTIEQALEEQPVVEKVAPPPEAEVAEQSVAEAAADSVSKAPVGEETPSQEAPVLSEATAEPVVEKIEEETIESPKTDAEHGIITEAISSKDVVEEPLVADRQLPVDLAKVQDGEEQPEKMAEPAEEEASGAAEVSQDKKDVAAVEAPSTEVEQVLVEETAVEMEKAVAEEIPTEVEKPVVEDLTEEEKPVAKEVPAEVEKAAVEEKSVELEKGVIEEIPTEAEKPMAEEVPAEGEKVVAEEIPVEVEKPIVEEITAEAEKSVVEEAPVEVEKAAVEETSVELDKGVVEEIPTEAETTVAEELPAELERSLADTPAEVEKAVVELPADAGKALADETPVEAKVDATEKELPEPIAEEEHIAEASTTIEGEQSQITEAAVDAKDEVMEKVTEAVSKETLVDSAPISKGMAEKLAEPVDVPAGEEGAVEASVGAVDEREEVQVKVKEDVEQIGELEQVQNVPSVGEGEDTVLETAEIPTSVRAAPVVETDPVVEEADETPITRNLAVNALAVETPREQDIIDAPVVEEKDRLEEPKEVTMEESTVQLSEASVSHEIGDTGAATLKDVAKDQGEVLTSMDDSLVSEVSEADTTTETIIVPEPETQKKSDSVISAAEELGNSHVDEMPILVQDEIQKDKLQLDVPSEASQLERPKSPWTPSFQVTTIGQGVSLLSEEDIPVHSLEGSEATTAVSSEEVPVTVKDESNDTPTNASEEDSEEKGELKSASSLWTPSYSVHSQGSPNPPHISLEPEIPATTDKEIEVETTIPAVEPTLVHENAATEKPEPEHVDSQPIEAEQVEKVAIDTMNVTEEPVTVLENTVAESPDVKEQFNEVLVEETPVAVPTILEQEDTSAMPRVEERLEEIQPALETAPAALQLSEQHTAQDGPSLTPPERQSRSASPSWVPSYSVSTQGSPLPRPISLPSADISEIRLAPPQTGTLVQEDRRNDASQDEASSVTAPTIVADGTQAFEAEKAEHVEDHPATPFTTSSYSVTVQGADVFDETVLESLSPPTQLDKGKEPEVRPRRSLSDEMESGAFSPTALIGAGVTGGAAVYAASAALRNSNDGNTTTDTVEPEMHQEKQFPTVQIPDGNKHNIVPRVDGNDASNATVARSPESSPISSRKRLESTTSSRLFPGGWFSNSSKIPDERTSLEVAQGVFTGVKEGGSVEESLQSPTSPAAEPITPIRDQSSSDKRKWCVIM